MGVLQTTLCPVTVGRESEMQLLTEVLETARLGEGHAVVITGDAGLGKTRLASDLRRMAAEAGMATMWGGCSELDLALPYLPFLEAIGNHLSRIDRAGLRRRLTVNQHELAWLFPQLELPEPARDPSDPVQGKLRLYEAVLSLLRLCAETSGLLIVLENMHRADASSRELLEYLVRRARGTRMMLVVTCRIEGLDRRDPLRALVDHWRRSGLGQRIDLTPFGADRIGEMTRATFGIHSLGREVCQLLCERSDGNPFVLEELLKEALDRGAVSREDEGWRPETLERLRLPPTVRDSVLGRLAHLPDDAAEILRCASVLGRSFDYGLLVAISRHGPREVQSALRVCVQQQLLEEDPDAPGHYRFRHSLTREAVYDDLLVPQREELHGAAADALRDRSDTSAVELYRHLLAARRELEAVPMGLAAAEQAMQAHAYDDAAQLYERILPRVADPAQHAELLCQLGRAFLLHGHTARAERRLGDGVRALERIGDRRRAARHRLWLGRCHWERSRPDLAAAEYESARAVLEPLGPSEDLALAYVRLASLAAFELDGAQAVELASRAVSIAAAASADSPRIWAYNFLGLGHIQLGHVAEGLAHVDRSYREAADRGLNVVAANALYNGILVRLQHQRPLEALSQVDALRSMQAGSMGQLQALRAEGSVYLWGLGQPARALTAYEEALALAREGQAHNYVNWIVVQLAVAHLQLDHLDRARELLPDRSEAREGQYQVDELWAAIRLELDAGRIDAALPAAREVLEGQAWPLRVRLFLGDVAVEALVAAGQADDARRFVDGLAGADPEHPYLRRMRGRIAHGKGQLEQAVAELRGAAHAFREAGCRHEEARSRLALAEALADTGQAPAARIELRAALDSAGSRGAALEARMAREALSRLGSRTITDEHARQALECLHQARELSRSELASLLGLTGHDDQRRLHELIVSEVARLATSDDGREREAGRLLQDYYVRRLGSQEMVADRLHLTRATFYRRLRMGWHLLAGRLTEPD